MTTLIGHLLAHHLATNETAAFNAAYVLGVMQTERAVAKCEAEEGLGGPVMHRWNLRLASLIAPSLLPPIRAIGLQLVHATFTLSSTSLLSQSKATLALSLNILGANRPDPTLFVAAMRVVQLILVRSTWHVEWAREVVGAAVIQRTVQSFVSAANGEITELRIPAINAIVTLLPLFPTPLRPLSPALHTLALASLCDTTGSIATINAGSTLFVSLYLLAPKGRDGLREAWRKGIEALVGSIDGLVPAVTSDIFAEDPLMNHTLSPLALPPMPTFSPVAALARLEALSHALCYTLRTPTSERTGPVEVPVGALVELGIRLVGMSVDMPVSSVPPPGEGSILTYIDEQVKERTDPTTLTHTLSLLPRLQVSGCQLLAQLTLCVGPRLVAHASEILGVVARTLSTYTLRSPMRPTLSTTYSIIHSALGSSIDPEDGKKSLARVWRSVLEDIGSVAVEPLAAAASEVSRKNKRQKTYDPSENMDLAGKRVRLDEVDLAIASRGLATLERLLASPHSHFLPPKLQIATCRLLLAISLDPAFFASHPSSAESSTFFPATCASKGIDIAKQSDEFRRGVIASLKASLEGGAGVTDGLIERAAEVWRRGSTDSDEFIKSLSVTALTKFSTLIHPSLPPLQINTTFERLKQERLGGPVGDDISITTGANEFRSKEEGEEDAEEAATSMASMPMDEEIVEVIAVVAPAAPFSATSFPTFASSNSAFTSFSSKSTVDKSSVEAAVEDPSTATTTLDTEVSSIPTFMSVSTTDASNKKNVPMVDEEDSDDEDFVMPTILMESDEE